MPHLSARRAWKILPSFNSIVEPGRDSEKDVGKEVAGVISSSHSSSSSPGILSSSIEGNRSAKEAGVSSRRPAGASESSESGFVASEKRWGGGLE